MTHKLSFIETQFPVSRLSKESYKERKANHGQTLTGLGKWWGRKPLILVRASIVGLLLSATDKPTEDRDVFLRLLTMDDEGMRRRRNKSFTVKELYELLTPSERREAFVPETTPPRFRRELTADEKKDWQDRAFLRLNYDKRLEMCARPEEIEGPSEASWEIINAHCDTTATCLPEWIQAMGVKRFGHPPRVGDAFCGGGSIPFEAARIGCEAYGSDLSPVAALLTWAALNIVGGGTEVADEVREALKKVYDAAKDQIEAWGVERNAAGWTADAYLYCHEAKDRSWTIPLAPSWVIGERTKTIAVLIPRIASRDFQIDIRQGVSDEEMADAKLQGTWDNGVKCPVDENGNFLLPTSRPVTRVDSLRGREGLRRWQNEDLVPRPEDVFQERLYCIRWRLPNLKDLLWAEQSPPHRELHDRGECREIEGLKVFLSPEQQEELDALRARNWHVENASVEASKQGYETVRKMKGAHAVLLSEEFRKVWEKAREVVEKRDSRIAALSATIPASWYAAPDEEDEKRERQVLSLLRDRFEEWQKEGFIPSAIIEPGNKTDEPIRTRGFTHWHHLFNPRQLLTLGLFASLSNAMQFTGAAAVGVLLVLGKLTNYNSRLCIWHSAFANENAEFVFLNQSLNTLANYGIRTIVSIHSIIFGREKSASVFGKGNIKASDARGDISECDIWITDPAYADAINYEELSEFFLAWYDKRLQKLFPTWHTDSRRALAVRGSDEPFRLAMTECFRNFVAHMPDDGFQIVMFTHTDAEVWSDLTLILWAAGLRVSQAWTIATETEASGLKSGNYVQGTVVMVLRKQTGDRWGDLADVFPEVQREVERQMDTLLALDDRTDRNLEEANERDPNKITNRDFDDSDYQLAAYAAALRVLTSYKTIQDIEVERELRRVRKRGETSPLTDLIESAVKIASNYLVPKGIEKSIWRELKPDERLYVKGLEIEAHGDYRTGVYMEFARGYGVKDYRPLLASDKANQSRLKTPTEFKSSGLNGEGFAETLLRHVLFAVYKTGEEDDPLVGRNYLRQELPDYWGRRNDLVGLLNYLSRTPTPAMTHWARDRQFAELLAGLIENDSL